MIDAAIVLKAILSAYPAFQSYVNYACNIVFILPGLFLLISFYMWREYNSVQLVLRYMDINELPVAHQFKVPASLFLPFSNMSVVGHQVLLPVFLVYN